MGNSTWANAPRAKVQRTAKKVRKKNIETSLGDLMSLNI